MPISKEKVRKEATKSAEDDLTKDIKDLLIGCGIVEMPIAKFLQRQFECIIFTFGFGKKAQFALTGIPKYE